MRSWNLLCSSLVASLISVFSFVIPFCLFLNFQQSHLIHIVSNGMQVMIYLTPLLIIFAWICYLVVFAFLKPPTRIFERNQILKINLLFFIGWMLLVTLIALEDQVNQLDSSTLLLGLKIYLILIPMITLGCMSANLCHLVLNKNRKYKSYVSVKSF